MKKIFLFLFLFIPLITFAQKPVVFFDQPKDLSTYSENLVRLIARKAEGATAIGWVEFRASYKNRNYEKVEDELIAKITKGPYEAIWNVTGIPDQAMWHISLSMVAVDASGNTISKERRTITLDRNRSPKPMTLDSWRRSTAPIVDGKLDDWPKDFPLLMESGDNRIYMLSAWTSDSLYFAIKLYDERLTVHSAQPEIDSSTKLIKDWLDDSFILFMDLDHTRSQCRGARDLTFSFNLQQKWINSFIIPGSRVTPFQTNANLATQSFGTYNQNWDKDSLVIVELAFPWSSLKLDPKPGITMGFDIFNRDIDSEEPWNRTSLSWSGNSFLTHGNPSEWGTLKLKEDRTILALFLIVVAVFSALCIGWIFIIRIKKKKEEVRKKIEEKDPKLVDPTFLKIMGFIEENLHTGLKIDNLADHLCMSERSCKRLIASKFGISFTDLLRNKRLEKAKAYLIETEMAITQITDKVGLKDSRYFTKIFKKEIGINPLEFRKKSRVLK